MTERTVPVEPTEEMLIAARDWSYKKYGKPIGTTHDDWKLMSPDDERDECEFCGSSGRICRAGWQPDCCTGECGRSWRDPDYERDLRMEGRP